MVSQKLREIVYQVGGSRELCKRFIQKTYCNKEITRAILKNNFCEMEGNWNPFGVGWKKVR